MKIWIGCAGWAIPSAYREIFAGEGSHLERYARRFNAVEINSSFYRPHRTTTYARWAMSVADGFRFAVKVPRVITHERRLQGTDELLDRFLAEITGLGEKLGPLLVQLPPSLPFQREVARAFFAALRARCAGSVVCEPRHGSWFGKQADELLVDLEVARVAADPAPAQGVGEPGGWKGIIYYRLHGSPDMYYSAYTDSFLESLVDRIRQAARDAPVWCIFDNTALGAATTDALALMGLVSEREGRASSGK